MKVHVLCKDDYYLKLKNAINITEGINNANFIVMTNDDGKIDKSFIEKTIGLNELTDIELNNVAHNQILQYDQSKNKFINVFKDNNDELSLSMAQLDINVTELPTDVIIEIPETLTFKKLQPYLIKYISGQTNIIRTSFNFNLNNNILFDLVEENVSIKADKSKYLIFDGKLKLKTSYECILNNEGEIGDDLFLMSIDLISDNNGIGFIDPSNNKEYKFKEISSLVI